MLACLPAAALENKRVAAKVEKWVASRVRR